MKKANFTQTRRRKMRKPEFVAMQCPTCGSIHYAILSVKIDNQGHFTKSIVCANKKCRQNIGQLEPNSVVANLRNINNTLAQITDALKKMQPDLKLDGSNEMPLQDPIESDAYKNKFPAYPQTNVAAATDVPAKADTNDDAALPAEKPIGTTPEEDPEFSDPEADQSLG